MCLRPFVLKRIVNFFEEQLSASYIYGYNKARFELRDGRSHMPCGLWPV